MTQYAGQFGPVLLTDETGTPQPTATVTLRNAANTANATPYADRDRAALTNPLPTGVAPGLAGVDTDGSLLLFADPGRYVLRTVVGSVTRNIPIVVGVDPDEQVAADDHLGDGSAAHPASAVSVTPVGGVAATDVQGAIAELDSDKAPTHTHPYDPAGTASAAVAAHEGAVDPHAGYLTEAAASGTYVPLSQRGAANGVATLDAGGTVPDAQLPAAVARDSEVTAAVAAHEADTTSVHGIADTALLETQAGAQAKADAAKARATHTGTQTAATISDLTETVQDIVGAALVAGTGATVTYDDVAGTVTIALSGGGGLTAEDVRDTIGLALVAGTGIDVTVNDPGDTITISLDADAATQAELDAHAAAADPHAGYVLESSFDADTILKADTDNTPSALAVAASTLVGRAATGGIAALTVAQVKALLALAAGDISGLAAIATSGSASDLAAGTVPVARLDTAAEAERIRDVIAAALVAGSNVTITPNDAADTITIAASGSGGGGPTVVRKAADETVNNLAVLQDDDHLSLALAANETWVGELLLHVAGNTTSADIKIALTVPTGASIIYNLHGPRLTDGLVQTQTGATAGGTELSAGHQGSPTALTLVRIAFSVTNGSTAGNLRLQWAQNTATVADLVLKAGSFLVAHKIA